MSDSGHMANDGIAIVGMAGRFPGAANVEEFWENLKAGVESVTFFSDEELSAEGINLTLLDHPDYVKAGAILQEIELFDASFFGFTPREAEVTDPQHRLFLECAWEALESTGYDPDTYHGLIGTYGGQGSNGYFYNNVASHPEIVESLGPLQVTIGNDKDHLATHVSYKMNLKGPSLTVQTSCSTSLVAVHLACESLLNYRCDMALAGGVSVKVPHKKGYLYQKGSINSPDGHCRAFDAGAQGVIGGNGVGVVILKRLEDALADGDTIYAVIRGSAINNDGAAKVGYTAPGLEGQGEVIAMAQAAAEVEADSITYIEAHGTGTALGDPIEIAALTQVWRASTEGIGLCAVGSVKTNIGHLDAAAGAVGLIKTALSLRHAMIPPSLHFQNPNPEIDFANSPFFVNTHLRPWVVREGQPRRAGVSSFGIGGTNAHIILEQAPATEPPGNVRPLHLLTLSAKSDTALEKMSTNLAQHLELNSSLNLHDVAYTLQAGRKAFKYRCAFVCRDAVDAVNVLRTGDPLRLARGLAHHQNRPVVFMFSGQGSQRIDMARELYEVERAFSEQVDLCAELLTPHLGLDLRENLYPTEAKAPEAAQQINQTSLTQPTLFVIEYALAKLWTAWGVKPHAMVGHSIGEYVAACLAGVLTLEEALKLVALRGQMVQQVPVGSMLAVALAEEELTQLLDTNLSIAAINGPRDCVVSGPTELVNDLEIRLSERGVATSRLRTSHAFHSAMMSPILESFYVEVQKVNLQPPRIPYLSNVTGTWITAGEATDPSHWVRHLRQTVRFSDGVKELAQQPDWVLLELGPAQTLTSIVKQHHPRASEQLVFSTLPQSGSSMSEYEHLLKISGELWLSGVNLAWTRVYDHWRKQRVPLPTYPFERQTYWLTPATSSTPKSPSGSKEKKTDIADWFYVPSWNRSVAQTLLSAVELREHKSIWLIFADTTSLNAGLRKRLEEGGQEVVTVVEGGRFEQAGERVYTLNPGERSHYIELLKDLRERELFPHQVFHLWGITEPSAAAEMSIASLVRSQAASFYSLLFLAQALGSRNVSDPIHITVVSNDLHAVTGEELLNPLKATSLGARRVLAQEYPNLDSRSIDIVLPTIGTPPEARLIDALITEALGRPKGRTVAYRGTHRWVQSFSPARLEHPLNERGRLREGGVYLITNGLAELGLALAEHLFSQCRAQLILTTPDAFPARGQWSDWLAAHDEQDETRRRIEKLIKLEKSGAEVAIFHATTGNLPEFQRAVEMAIERFSRINGLIHAEDILDGGLIQLKTSMADAVLTPKVEGMLALEALLGNAPLDFIVLFSSVIASAGGSGLVGYCAANAFLDAFAHYKTLTSDTPTVAIDWDILHWDTRQESLAPDIPEVQTQIRTLRDKFGIRLEEALEAFTRVLASNHSQVVVSTRDFAAIFEQQDAAKVAGLMEQLGKLRSTAGPSQRLSPDEYEAPRNSTEQQMADIWQRLFGIEGLGINENFFDLGGNSLLAIQLLSQIRDTFGLEIPVDSPFDSPTIAGLSNLIIENQLQVQFGDLDKLLDTIEGLSKQEVSELLRKELQAGVQEATYE